MGPAHGTGHPMLASFRTPVGVRAKMAVGKDRCSPCHDFSKESKRAARPVSESCLRWNSNGSGVTLWPKAAFPPKVLARSYLNQPVRLAQFDPPPHRERSGRSSCVGPQNLSKSPQAYDSKSSFSSVTAGLGGVLPFQNTT